MAYDRSTAQTAKPRRNLYQSVTDEIIAQLAQGRVPWVQPWTSAGASPGMPYNASTGRPYSGIDILTLWNAVVATGFESHAFLTFRQVLALGGNVRRSERGTSVVFARVPGRERQANARDTEDDAARRPANIHRLQVPRETAASLPHAWLEP